MSHVILNSYFIGKAKAIGLARRKAVARYVVFYRWSPAHRRCRSGATTELDSCPRGRVLGSRVIVRRDLHVSDAPEHSAAEPWPLPDLRYGAGARFSAGTDALDELAVRIEPAQRRLANIETAEVQLGPVEATLQTVGSIAIDESRQATIAAYIDGRLERLFADYTGVHIKKGDHLAIIYSPQLYGAQVEYLEAKRVLNAAGGLPAVRGTGITGRQHSSTLARIRDD